MDLATLAECSGLEHRSIRYVVDQCLVLRRKSDHRRGRGKARRFDDTGAFAVLVAATLHEFGLSRRSIKQYMPALPALRAFQISGVKTMTIGTDRVRIVVDLQSIRESLLATSIA